MFSRKIQAVKVILSFLFVVCFGSCHEETGGDRRPTQEEFDQVVEINEEGMDYFISLRNKTGDINYAIEETAARLRSQAGVRSVYVSGSEVITVGFASGMFGHLLLKSGDVSHSSFYRSYMQDGRKNAGVERNALIEGGKALILLPMCWTFGDENSLPIIRDALFKETDNFQIEQRLNKEANIDAFWNMYQYNVVYIHTHGMHTKKGNKTAEVLVTGTYISKNFSVTDNSYFTTGFDIATVEKNMKGTVSGQCNIPEWDMTEDDCHEENGKTVCPSISFLAISQNYFKNMPNFSSDTLVWVNACSSYKEGLLAKTFTNRGAGAYFGWDNTNNTFFSSLMIENMFPLLTKTNVSFAEVMNSKVINIEGTDYSANELFPAAKFVNADNEWGFGYNCEPNANEPDECEVLSHVPDYSIRDYVVSPRISNPDFVLNPSPSDNCSEEICNEVDDDCDGLIDNTVGFTSGAWCGRGTHNQYNFGEYTMDIQMFFSGGFGPDYYFDANMLWSGIFSGENTSYNGSLICNRVTWEDGSVIWVGDRQHFAHGYYVADFSFNETSLTGFWYYEDGRVGSEFLLTRYECP